MSDDMPFHWEKFLLQGKILFDYMIDNFENMFDGDLIIKTF